MSTFCSQTLSLLQACCLIADALVNFGSCGRSILSAASKSGRCDCVSISLLSSPATFRWLFSTVSTMFNGGNSLIPGKSFSRSTCNLPYFLARALFSSVDNPEWYLNGFWCSSKSYANFEFSPRFFSRCELRRSSLCQIVSRYSCDRAEAPLSEHFAMD